MLGRRTLLRSSVGVVAASLLPLRAHALPEALARRLAELFGDRPMTASAVTLTLPALSENGSSVSLEVAAESPMTAEDYVATVTVLAEKNPLSEMVRFHFTPASGRARAGTRVRLADSQTLAAVAETGDGRLLLGTAEVVVTLAACINLS